MSERQTVKVYRKGGCGGCVVQLAFLVLSVLALAFLVYNWDHVWLFVTTGVW